MADEAFQFTIMAKTTPEGIQTGTSGAGQPKSAQEFQDVMLSLAARPLAALYESWLLGTNRENTADMRALFFIDHQPAILRTFMSMADSPQFSDNVAARREAMKKAQESASGAKPE
ncbi:MAG: hypothetical protein HDQ91_00115 [Desulfovibrio sp.]|nr:hypothetical protein [Desulfovibrio sp.]